MDIIQLLQTAKSSGASDLHLIASRPPLMRIDGSLRVMPDAPALRPDELEGYLKRMTTPEQQARFRQDFELDFGCSITNLGRIRCNAALQRGSVSFVIRMLPSTLPSIENLGVPDVCKQLVLKRRGLVVVSGPTGSGKSTTLAAMINYLNKTEGRRVVTIEDPIEYVYNDQACAITQRELGSDTRTFAEALRHVLRQDPDVILVGEMRDMETAAAALTIAETGHLVLTTGHAPSASQAVERILDLFPPHERHLAQSQLASFLVGIFCQALIPKAEGRGRVAAIEVLLANSAVRNIIREGKVYQLPNTIRMNTEQGMQLMDQALVDLFRRGLITRDSMMSYCTDIDEISKITSNVPSPKVPASF